MFVYNDTIKLHGPNKNHHCSPTLSPLRFLPRPPRPTTGENRAGLNGFKLIILEEPSNTSSAIAFPQAGAHAIPLRN